MDDEGKLKVRARTIVEAEVFLEDLLNDTLINNSYGSFKDYDLSSPIVHVGFSFDGVKMERALIKIGINALIHYFPQVKGHRALTPYINYVLLGTDGFRGGIEKRIKLLTLYRIPTLSFFLLARKFKN
ncbi:hypothetical protein ACQ86K_12780 [Mucilaginibacter sp. P19]|uniref:hypothetical protein n=1 Tax=Mucilaginibacter sp. P19 TaxID=3423947 RepID=UPI003D667E17